MTEETSNHSPRAPVFFRLHLLALEDLHTGSGTGSGDIDALVARDRYGRPVIPASHYQGLLNEAGRELVAFGRLAPKELQALLGAPGGQRAALSMTSLRVPPNKRLETRIWGASARKSNSRSPQDDTLRFVEYVDAGTHFVARLRLENPELEGLLERLLSRVDRVGGSRNRGGGLVLARWKRVSPKPIAVADTPAEPARLRLVLRNLEPLCLPASGHPGNVIRSHSFVRGQTLGGALLAWALNRGESAGALEGVEVGDALPLPHGWTQASAVLPIPLSIQTPKPTAHGSRGSDGGDSVRPWWAGGTAVPTAFDGLFAERDPAAEKTKRPGPNEYLCRDETDGRWIRYAPPVRVRLRHQTPRAPGGETELFSQEEIAEDTCFQSELRFTDAASAERFIKAFAPLLRRSDWLGLGRGGQPVQVESSAFLPAAELPSIADEWTITLTSDLIARGPHLGFLDDLDIDTLCRWAGIAKGEDWVLDPTRVVETEVVHGFNAASGLHRIPAVALRRGSCWRVRGTGSAVLARALGAKAALGERTPEGLGRFLVDVQPIPRLGRLARGQAAPPRNRHEDRLGTAFALARRLSDPAKGPSRSQLQWLRSRARAAADEVQLEGVLRAVEEARRRPQGGGRWVHFPLEALRDELTKLDRLPEKRLLISHLARRLLPKAGAPKETR